MRTVLLEECCAEFCLAEPGIILFTALPFEFHLSSLAAGYFFLHNATSNMCMFGIASSLLSSSAVAHLAMLP